MYREQPLNANDSARIEELLRGAGVSPASLEAIATWEETRLRFNALSPVVVYRVRAVQGADFIAEVFHWLVDDEWELVSLSLA